MCKARLIREWSCGWNTTSSHRCVRTARSRSRLTPRWKATANRGDRASGARMPAGKRLMRSAGKQRLVVEPEDIVIKHVWSVAPRLIGWISKGGGSSGFAARSAARLLWIGRDKREIGQKQM